jgi:hypothetical protein
MGRVGSGGPVVPALVLARMRGRRPCRSGRCSLRQAAGDAGGSAASCRPIVYVTSRSSVSASLASASASVHPSYRPCCLRLWLQRLRPHTPPAAGPLRPAWRRAARRCGGAPICQAGACGDGGSAESPTTRLTRQRRRPHRDCAGPSNLSPRRCPIRPRRRWPPSARADKSSVAPDDQARAAQMGRIAALGATRRRTRTR